MSVRLLGAFFHYQIASRHARVLLRSCSSFTAHRKVPSRCKRGCLCLLQLTASSDFGVLLGARQQHGDVAFLVAEHGSDLSTSRGVIHVCLTTQSQPMASLLMQHLDQVRWVRVELCFYLPQRLRTVYDPRVLHTAASRTAAAAALALQQISALQQTL